jgi:20S proteasome subunit beta 1
MANKVVSSSLVPDWMGAELTTGTTILAVEYDGGVVIGADSRTTTGAYVANRVTDKLTRITDKIYCCRSGSAADTQAIADIVAYHLSVHQMEIGEEPSVKTAAAIFQDMCYNYRDQLSAGIICAGWDRKLGGQVYSIPLGGMCTRQKVTMGGSGSTYIYGFIDSQYKENMSEAECLEFAKNAISLAMLRDGGSGGIIRLASINESGVSRKTILHEDLPKFPFQRMIEREAQDAHK